MTKHLLETRNVLALSRSDIVQLMSPRDYLDAVEEGFRASADGALIAPPPLHLAVDAGGIHVKAASIRGKLAAFKLNANFPTNPARGLPTIQGAIVLFDLNDGRVLAIMDSIEITLRRTAAATALAARALAQREDVTITICGCGAQAAPQLEALSQVVTIANGRVYDADAAKAEAFAPMATRLTGAPFQPAHSLSSATRESDIIVTCTTARAPILGVQDVRAGAFIAAVGADSPVKSEIAPALMARAKVVVDSLDQCVVMGDLHNAIAAGAMTAADVYGQLAQVLAGKLSSKPDPSDIIIFDSTGVAHQDAASAAVVYARAVESGAGARVSLA